jgi:hypothetical protein
MSAALQTPELPPEAIELINAGKPKPLTTRTVTAHNSRIASEANSTAEKQPADASQREPLVLSQRAGPADEKVGKVRTNRDKENEMATPVSVVSRSFRLPGEVATALLRASTERRINRMKPSSQEEMVTEAISQWLKRNGYLTA